MNIPGIPTDSLYKWLAITGVLIAIFNVYIFISFVWEWRNEIAKYQAEIGFLNKLTRLGFIFGMVLATIGFILWYKRSQKYIDLEQRAKAEEQEINLDITKLKLAELKNNTAST